MATIQEENCSLSRTSRHLAVVTVSSAQKNKLSLQRHSSVLMLSFDAEVEELNIATRADTRMTVLSPPSSYSITNGRVWWYQRLFPYQTDKDITPSFHKLTLLLKAAPPSKTCLKALRRRRQLQLRTTLP